MEGFLRMMNQFYLKPTGVTGMAMDFLKL
jgi:hypothetical protein